MSDPLFDILRKVTTATITTMLLKKGIRRCWMSGAKPLVPGGERLVGPAFTLRFVPVREDLATPESWASPISTRAAIEAMPEGVIAVADAMGVQSAGIFGDILCARMHKRNVTALVTDGVMRDLTGVLVSKLPVWCSGVAAPASVNGLTFVGWQEPIACGGCAIFPNDVIVVDDDGAVVIPQALVEFVAHEGAEHELYESWVFTEVEKGVQLPGTLSAERRSQGALRRVAQVARIERIMFFILSKLLGFIVLPSNLVVEIGLVGIVLLLTNFRRLASWLIVTSVVLTALVGFSPLGNLLILPLEQRFPPWDSSRGAPDGIVVLGGSILPEIAARRGDESGLNEAAERITATVELARKYPNARIIFTGGNAALFESVTSEAAVAVRLFVALGVSPDRITAEEQSRNTIENAVFSRADRAAEAGRALAPRDIGLAHAACHGGVPRRGLSDRSLSGRLPHPGTRRRDAAVFVGRLRHGADRSRDARMGRPYRLSADRQDRRVLSRALTAALRKKAFLNLSFSRSANHLTANPARGLAQSRPARLFTCPSRLMWNRCPSCFVRWEDSVMSTTDVPADFTDQPAEELVEAQSASSKWAETALTVLFTVTAVLFVSFVAVVAGIV